jgi:hypothetical protein
MKTSIKPITVFNFKNNSLLILFEFLLWLAAVGMVAWLWDRWMLEGPHGPFRWVGMDFAPFWVGVREMFHGVNPYSPEVLTKIQQVVYGGPALKSDPMMFVYPAWMYILILPLSLLPFQWAAILYSGTLLWGMLNFLYLISLNLRSASFASHIFWITWLILGSLPFLVISVTKGQLGYLGLLALFISRRIWDRHPDKAGIILGLALIKPTVTVIPTLGYLLWALFRKDWRFIAGFIGCMLILLITSLLAVGNWIPAYLEMLAIKGGMPVFWSVDILSSPWKWIYISFYIVLGVYTFWTARKNNHRDLWLSTTYLISIALSPMRWIYDLYLGILIPPENNNFTRTQFIVTALAVFSPWILAFVPGTSRWHAAVIGLPLIWTVCLLFLFSKSLLPSSEAHPRSVENSNNY